jgi:hypothetical protein
MSSQTPITQLPSYSRCLFLFYLYSHFSPLLLFQSKFRYVLLKDFETLCSSGWLELKNLLPLLPNAGIAGCTTTPCKDTVLKER